MKKFIQKLKYFAGHERTWRWVGGIVVAALVLCGIFAVVGWYPVALVDGHPIWASSFYEIYQSGYAYWSGMLGAKQGNTMTSHVQNTIRGLAFESAIDEYLIMRKLTNDIGSAVLGDKILSAQHDAENDPSLQQAIAQAGISSVQDVRYFIRQIAEYNLLDGDVRLENTTASAWLLEARKQAHVVIFMPGYRWTGSGIDVVARGGTAQ